MDSRGYFRTQDGRKIYFDDIARQIKAAHPKLVGRHIFTQLMALDLYTEFSKGETPCALPYTFI